TVGVAIWRRFNTVATEKEVHLRVERAPEPARIIWLQETVRDLSGQISGAAGLDACRRLGGKICRITRISRPLFWCQFRPGGKIEMAAHTAETCAAAGIDNDRFEIARAPITTDNNMRDASFAQRVRKRAIMRAASSQHSNIRRRLLNNLCQPLDRCFGDLGLISVDHLIAILPVPFSFYCPLLPI